MKMETHISLAANARTRLSEYCQANGLLYCQEHKGGELLKEYFANHKNKVYGEFDYTKALQFAIDAL